MPSDENRAPQRENIIRSMEEAKQPFKLATTVEEISCRGQKRPALTERLNSVVDAPPSKCQRITTWLADSGSHFLAHARPLGTRVACGVKVCATKAAVATSQAAATTG